MKRLWICVWASLIVACISTTSGLSQELYTEVQAPLSADGEPYFFRVLGDPDPDDPKVFSAYGIHVIAPTGDEHMLDEFDSLLPAGGEADVLVVEDLDFDGFADLRLMKFLPGGANVPYYYWLFDPTAGRFVLNEAFEVILSPQTDASRQEIRSLQRLSATETLVDIYKSSKAGPVWVGREERVYNSDQSSALKRYEVKNGVPALIETRTLKAGES